MATSLRLAAAGDFDGLMKNRLPPADYATWRSQWNKAHAAATPPSAARAQQFAEIMHMLTEPGAEAKLAKRLKPELAKLRGGNRASLPIASGILAAAGKQVIGESPQLGPSQRALAERALTVLIAWVKTTDFSDPKKARKAIDLVCASARELHVTTLAQWQALDYATTQKDYAILWKGLEDLLKLYGLDLARSLTAADITTTPGANDTHATVHLTMQLAGQPLAAAWPMVKQAGHWYDVSLLDAWHAAHPAPAASVAAAAAAASVAGAASAAPTQSVSNVTVPATTSAEQR